MLKDGELVYKAMEARQHRIIIEEIDGRRFQTFWRVTDRDNGFVTVADGFKTKAEAIAYANSTTVNWFVYMYEKEI